MASSAYNRYATAPAYAPTRKRPTASRPDVHVVSGGKVTQVSFAPRASTAIIVAAVLLIVLFTALSLTRIAITSSTIATSIKTQVVSEQLETVRSEGNTLEVNLTSLANASSIKARAQALGMAAATDIEALNLKQDVVALDSAGNLSLSESVRRASNVS